MRVKLPLVVAVLLAMTVPGLAQHHTPAKPKSKSVDQMLVEKSRATWEAYKSRNIAGIKALTAPEYVSHTLGGPSNLEQDIATIDKLTIESFSITEPKVTWASKTVAILTYKCDLKGSYDGKVFGPVYSTEVWVNRGGKWMIISYSETLIT